MAGCGFAGSRCESRLYRTYSLSVPIEDAHAWCARAELDKTLGLAADASAEDAAWACGTPARSSTLAVKLRSAAAGASAAGASAATAGAAHGLGAACVVLLTLRVVANF